MTGRETSLFGMIDMFVVRERGIGFGVAVLVKFIGSAVVGAKNEEPFPEGCLMFAQRQAGAGKAKTGSVFRRSNPHAEKLIRYLVFGPTLTRLTPSKVVFPVAFGGVLRRATIPVFLG